MSKINKFFFIFWYIIGYSFKYIIPPLVIIISLYLYRLDYFSTTQFLSQFLILPILYLFGKDTFTVIRKAKKIVYKKKAIYNNWEDIVESVFLAWFTLFFTGLGLLFFGITPLSLCFETELLLVTPALIYYLSIIYLGYFLGLKRMYTIDTIESFQVVQDKFMNRERFYGYFVK